jgi:hypothetical protein
MSDEASITVPASWRPARGRPAVPKRHARKCCICRHPQRDAIERAFLHWRSPERIARDYGSFSHMAIYRHAHACGLYDRRLRILREGLEQILEHSEDCLPAAHMIIRAAEAYSRLPESWIGPRTPRSPAVTYVVANPESLIVNRSQAENDATH